VGIKTDSNLFTREKGEPMTMKFPYFLELTKDEMQALTDLLSETHCKGPLSNLYFRLCDFEFDRKYRVVGDEDIPIVLEAIRKGK
jgi:hypothetical protein